MMLVGDRPLLLSLAQALLGFKCAPVERVLPTGPNFTDLLAFRPETFLRAGACPFSLSRSSPPNLEISPQTQHPWSRFGSRTSLSGWSSSRIAHMRALLSPGDPSAALGVGSMLASSLALCASACRLRNASASFAKSIPFGSCTDIMNGLAAGVYGSRRSPAAFRTSPISSHAASSIFVSREI